MAQQFSTGRNYREESVKVDQNIVFIFPLCSILNQLKAELEKKSEYTVFEVDLINEYEQLIENLENAITFSSDHKKTLQYLELCHKTVAKRNHLNIIVAKKMPSGLDMSKMEKNGLNEFLADYTQLKSLMFKVNNFYKTVGQQQASGPIYKSKKAEKIDTQSLQRIERLAISEEEEKTKFGIDEISTKATEVIDTQSQRNVERLLNEEKDSKKRVGNFSQQNDNDLVFMTEALSKELTAKSKMNNLIDTESEQNVERLIAEEKDIARRVGDLSREESKELLLKTNTSGSIDTESLQNVERLTADEKKITRRVGDLSQEQPEDFLFKSKNENDKKDKPWNNVEQESSEEIKATRKSGHLLEKESKDLDYKSKKIDNETGDSARKLARFNEVEKNGKVKKTSIWDEEDSEELKLNSDSADDSETESEKKIKIIEKKLKELNRKRGVLLEAQVKELYAKSKSTEKIDTDSEQDVKSGEEQSKEITRKKGDLSQKQSKELSAKQKTAGKIDTDSQQDVKSLDEDLNEISRKSGDLSQEESKELYSRSKKHEKIDTESIQNIKKHDQKFKDINRKTGDLSQEEAQELYSKANRPEQIDTESLQQIQRLASADKSIKRKAIGERIVTGLKNSEKDASSSASTQSMQELELNLEKTIYHAQAENLLSLDKSKRVEIEDLLIQQSLHEGASEDEIADEDGDPDTLVYEHAKRKKQEALNESDAEALQLQVSRNKTVDSVDLPEIVYFPALKIFDPVAFYMEILYSNADVNFKKKYLKMCLSKVYRAQLYLADIDGVWEESTPLSLQEINVKIHTVPEWINEGRNEKENYFVLPVIFDDKFSSAVGLIVPEQLNHEKMVELEFWCYLSRCLCS